MRLHNLMLDMQAPARLQGVFNPPWLLRNAHLQTILSSVGPRKWRANYRFRPWRAQQQYMEIDCGEGVTLAGFLNRAIAGKCSDTLVVVVHGWEGSAESTYILSMTRALLDAGIDVFRLNLRDHGDTHHLNDQLFNSTLVDEVIGAVARLQASLAPQTMYLLGFSLGGNFCLRVAAKASPEKLQLAQVLAVCPVLHADSSNQRLGQKNNSIYQQYFVRKWKRSLGKKLRHFPGLESAEKLGELNTLDELNHYLIPRHTEFDQVARYFDAYAITGGVLAQTICNCHLVFAADDMIVPLDDVDALAPNPQLTIEVTAHGGHVGFLKNARLESWLEDRVLELIG